MADLAEILHNAQERGYEHNFEVDAGALRCKTVVPRTPLHELTVDDMQSVAHGSDPGDDATVLLITTKAGERGYLILSSPFYIDPESRDFVEQLRRRYKLED